MAIKIYCDCCEKLADIDPNFFCEIITQKIRIGLNQQMQEISQMNKKQFQLCRDCYEQKIEILFKSDIIKK